MTEEGTDRLFDVRGLNDRGWNVPSDIDWDEWSKSMKTIQDMDLISPWAIGDGILAGFIQFGDDVYQAIAERYEPKTINRMIAVCQAFPIARRKKGVSLWKVEPVKSYPTDFQDQVVSDVAEHNATIQDVRDQIDEYEGKGSADTVPPRECPLCRAESIHWNVHPDTVPDGKVDHSTGEIVQDNPPVLRAVQGGRA